MQPDSQFGPYLIIRRLGKSMNDVYLARDTREGRQAALKLIKAGPDPLSRLVLEAERRGAVIQQQLRALDPRVIEVYDYGDLDGYFFVAMQYVEGRSLAEALRGTGRFDPYRAAHVALDIVAQLAKFHSFRAGDGGAVPVVHGDIKPSNIHLGPNETVRLLDFGIAKSLRPDRDFTYHNFGSPSYCSPERLGRSRVDQQADLWAVAVTLYEMVAGAPPYQADSTRKLERLIQSGRPPRALPPDCPQALKAVISKALAPVADRRYTSAEALYADLKAFIDGDETLAEKEKRQPWRPNTTLEHPSKSPQPATAVRIPRPDPAAALRRLVRRMLRRRRSLPTIVRTAGACACVLTGLLVFMSTSYFWRYWTASRQIEANLDYAARPIAAINADWALYKDLQRQFSFLHGYSPVDRLQGPLRMAYTQAAADVLDSYDRGTDPALRHYDWKKAELCLSRARDLGASNQPSLARLALAQGYAGMLRIMDWTGHDATELESLRHAVRDHFAEAAQNAPDWPDPHLGLARIYLYSLPDYDRALDELDIADHLGYRRGPREIEQRADALRLRGLARMRAGNTEGARADFAAARGLYQTIPGFSLADYHLRQIPDLQPPPPPPPVHHPQHKPRRYR
jgi:serine/threonine protein kinase